MRKHRIEIRSLCVLQKVNPRDFDSDDEVKARKVGSETVEGRDTTVALKRSWKGNMRKDVWEMTVRERYVPIFYVNLCFYFNCVVDPNLQIDLSILRKCIFSMLTKCQNIMSLSGLVRSTTRRKFSKEHIFHYVLISYDSPWRVQSSGRNSYRFHEKNVQFTSILCLNLRIFGSIENVLYGRNFRYYRSIYTI